MSRRRASALLWQRRATQEDAIDGAPGEWSLQALGGVEQAPRHNLTIHHVQELMLEPMDVHMLCQAHRLNVHWRGGMIHMNEENLRERIQWKEENAALRWLRAERISERRKGP